MARPGAGRRLGGRNHPDESRRYAVARADKEQAAAELKRLDVAVKEIALKRQAGELLPIAEFERVLTLVIKSIVNWAETLPDILERDVGLRPDQVEAVQNCVDREREALYEVLGEIR